MDDGRAGVGSAYHLVRYLGWHRTFFNALVSQELGCTNLTWLDRPFAQPVEGEEHVRLDGGLRGLDFLEGATRAHEEWQKVWPAGELVPHWDAVARVEVGGSPEWLLVAAASTIEQLNTSCECKSADDLEAIHRMLSRTIEEIGLEGVSTVQWIHGYFDHASRVTALQFLLGHAVPARLLLVHFLNDDTQGRTCPTKVSEWRTVERERNKHLGLSQLEPWRGLGRRLHTLFLPVGGPS